MANQATDNRTNISTGESATGWEDIAGSARAVDTEISYDTYTGSIGAYCTTTRDATLYNNGATGLFTSGDHAYLLINCGIVSLLDTKALGGCTVRVTGATATDWAEFELFGSDEWPTAFAGGWVQIVVDIDELLANPTNTNGTPPTVGNIQRFGVTFITASVMPRMADNFWVGGFKRLPANTPAIIVEGRSGGTVDWTWDLISSVAGVQLSAVLLPGPGGSFVCRGPIQFGINDTTTHAFLETNKALLWDFQEVMLDGFYGLSALGNSGGSTSVTFGVKTGTGNAATGAQGGVIQAAPTGARWFMDFDDPNVDTIGLYGISLIHHGTLELDDPAVDIATVFFVDGDKAHVSNANVVRPRVITPNTADGVAFMDTDDLGDIANGSFEFSDGHGIEILSGGPASQDNEGNVFLGAYGGTPGDNNTPSSGSTDAMIYNNSAAAKTFNRSGGGTQPSFRNGASATSDDVATVTITFDKMRDKTEVWVFPTGVRGIGNEIAETEEATAGTPDNRNFAWSASSGIGVDYIIHHWDPDGPDYQHIEVVNFIVPGANTTIDIQQILDRNSI